MWGCARNVYLNGLSQKQNRSVDMTNAEKIRSMSDGELSEFLVRFKNTFGEEYEGEQSCLRWLQSENISDFKKNNHINSNKSPVTNADIIRSMSDEELARHYGKFLTCGSCPSKRTNECGGNACIYAYYDWLKRSIEETELTTAENFDVRR